MTKIKKIKHLKMPVVLKNALHNASSQCVGSSKRAEYEQNVRYGRGVVVGCVGALMATGMTFDEAWLFVGDNIPSDYDPRCIPDTWPIRNIKQEPTQ